MNKILLSGLVMSVVAPSVSFAEGCSSSGMYVALSVGESFNKNRVKVNKDSKEKLGKVQEINKRINVTPSENLKNVPNINPAYLEEIVSGLNYDQKISDLAKQDTNTAKIIISALQEVEKLDSIQEDTTVNDVRNEILQGISVMIENKEQELYKNIPSDGKFTFLVDEKIETQEVPEFVVDEKPEDSKVNAPKLQEKPEDQNVQKHEVVNYTNVKDSTSKTKGKVTADLTVGYEFVTDSSLILGVSGSFGTDFGKQKIDISKDKKSLSTLTVKNVFNIGITPYIGYKFNDTVDLCLLFGINMGRNKVDTSGLVGGKEEVSKMLKAEAKNKDLVDLLSVYKSKSKTSFSPVIGLASKINFGNGFFAILSCKTLLNAKIATVKKNGIDVKQNSYKFTAGIGMRF